ncbi:S24 family peptidase [Roseibium algae]|uniref:Helix-turn-helix transcriptional regulator n=1 Tax=Roseibium algae TaxID=3123038 RepID=A0ABU8TI04_9HYPH
MLSHAQVWAAIDKLAKRHELSPSGLAKRAGLDPTTFNPSKRFSVDERPRWPSTESLAKILEATGETLNAFVASITVQEPTASTEAASRIVPLKGLCDAGHEGTFDQLGAPTGMTWNQMSFPDPKAKEIFALEVTGDDMLPLYRDGDIIIVAPDAPIRRGDRVVVKSKLQALSVLLLHKRTDSAMEFQPLDKRASRLHFKHADIDWVGRIIWASQ